MYNFVQTYTTFYNNVQPYTTLYSHVQLCTALYKNVQPCTTMYNQEHLCTTMYNHYNQVQPLQQNDPLDTPLLGERDPPPVYSEGVWKGVEP